MDTRCCGTTLKPSIRSENSTHLNWNADSYTTIRAWRLTGLFPITVMSEKDKAWRSLEQQEAELKQRMSLV